ncbi:hypothetical protein VTJ83DRAFT_5211 [Remersonia thermophila]|uniref:Uncharacterized protein n=1 Tax=Remersonia thermophila TaxID=72144 RepID=A0ABR4DD51_9PEZI
MSRHNMDTAWPRSAGFPPRIGALLSSPPPPGGASHHHEAPETRNRSVAEPRVLSFSRLRTTDRCRRYSDSVPQLGSCMAHAPPSPGPQDLHRCTTAQLASETNRENNAVPAVSTPNRGRPTDLPFAFAPVLSSPLSPRHPESPRPTLAPSPRHSSSPALAWNNGTVMRPQASGPGEHEDEHGECGLPFLFVPGYASHPIHPRRPAVIPTRRDELAAALEKVDLKAGDCNVKGVGHLARPFLGGSGSLSPSLGSGLWGSGSGTRSTTRAAAMALNWFLDFADRTLLVPVPCAADDTPLLTRPPSRCRPGGDGHHRADARATTPSVTRSAGDMRSSEPPHPTQRELLRIESELFDTAKYCGVGASAARAIQHLTVLAWSDDAKHGAITLFEVHLSNPSPLREYRTPASSTSKTRTLAARRHHRPPAPLSVRTGRSRRFPQATLVRPVAAMELVPRRILAGLRADGEMRKLALHRDRATGRFRWTARHMPAGRRCDSPRLVRLRGADRDGNSDAGPAPAAEGEPHGIVATVPHLLALLHTTTSIVERGGMRGTPITAELVQTADGQRVRAVSLGAGVAGPRHRGRDVHVVVLVPDAGEGGEGPDWTEEPIFWTDDQGGLPELRQDKFADVVEGLRTERRRCREGQR